MVYQTTANGYVAFKSQSALGSQASGTGATILRTTGGQAGRLTKAAIESNEVRRDGMRSRGRHGTQKTTGAYSHEASIGLMDDVIQAVFRGTWESAVEIDQTDFTSITTGANTIVLASGSAITLGLRVGDVIRMTNHSSAGNNNKNLRVTALSATTITVAETLTVNAVADTSVTITRTGRKLINPAAGSLVERYFTIEENELDIDGSEVFTDCKWGSLKFTMQPNGLLTIDSTWVGTGEFEKVDGSNCPWFQSPTEPTGVPLAVVDATVRLGSSDLVDLTSFDLTIDIGPTAPDVFGSESQQYAPDVFSGQMAVSMNLTALRSDLSKITNFLNEDVLSLHVLAVENESEPKDFLSIYVPNFSLGSVDKSALNKAGGPRTQTLAIPAALVGKDVTGGAYDACMAKVQIANAS